MIAIEILKTFYRRAGNSLFIIFALFLFTGALEGISVSLLASILSTDTPASEKDFISRQVFQFLEFLSVSPTVANLLVFLVCAFILKAVIYASLLIYAHYVRIKIRKKLQIELIHSYANLDYRTHLKNGSGYVNNIIVHEIPRFLICFMEFTRLPVSVIHALIYFSFAILIDWASALALLGLGGVIFLLIRPLIRHSRAASRQVSSESGNLQSMIIEYVQNILYLRATRNLEPLIGKLQRSINHLGDQGLKISILSSTIKVINEPIAVLVISVIIFMNVVVGGQSITEVLILCFMLYRLLLRILDVQAVVQRFSTSIGGLELVENALNSLEENREKNGHIPFAPESSDIQFSGVSLSYENKEVLKDISLKINRNESIGIVGPSGAGKTSFFNLITGLMSPTRGEISMGGENFADVDKTSYRRNIGYVPQEPVILHDTMLNNIVLWRLDTNAPETIERVKKAMRDAGCPDLIPNLNNTLGERGIRLSGGERQRIAIAREILMEPQVLILDEATSALDSISERIVQESLAGLKNKCTILIIAHRLSTVIDCDRILVFREGRMIEEGSFDSLYQEESSFFREMCAKQGLKPRAELPGN